ncbi:MAG: ABC transporter ATP-binding protein [Candidatus Thiodiazotropha sp.]
MIAIEAKGLGKRYRRYARPLDSLKELILRRPYHDEYWAVQNVSFCQQKGVTLGLIGDNGAGKSSLLKMLSGTLTPTIGTLSLNGRVSAILELGSGFHPEFNGLDNARLGCAMLGLSQREIDERLPSIIEFSELGDAIARPVKTYSSGMYVRLAFSVVTSVDPDILVIDEALSVGEKCMDRMMGFREQGKSLIFCSHSIYQVRELCDQALWLDKGKLRLFGPVEEVVDAYQDHVRAQNSTSTTQISSEPSSRDDGPEISRGQTETRAWFEHIELIGGETLESGDKIFETHRAFSVSIQATAPGISKDDVHIGIVIKRNDMIQCYGVSTLVDEVHMNQSPDGGVSIDYHIDSLPLLSGEYLLDIYLLDASGIHVYDKQENTCQFQVRQKIKAVGMNWIDHRWE